MNLHIPRGIIVVIIIFTFTGSTDALDTSEIFWAGDSSVTFGEERVSSVLGLAVRNPPTGYTITPWIDDDVYDLSYAGLTVTIWNTTCFACNLYSDHYLQKCFDCFYYYNARYVVVSLGVNDLLNLATIHGGDVDNLINTTISFLQRIQSLGKTVFWVTHPPLDQDGLKDGMPYEIQGFISEGAGDFGQGKTLCTPDSESTDCGKHWNSNHEYFINQLRPWCEDNNVGFIDVFNYIRTTYGDANTDDFVEPFSSDGLHIAYPGTDSIYRYIRSQLETIYLSDHDNDGIPQFNDNCPGVSNPLQEDTDQDGFGDVCDNCPEVENEDQADVDGDGTGDVCTPVKAAIPTLSKWGIIIFMIIIMGTGVVTVVRRRMV